jgi:type IV pilus assembly protein PilC
MNVDLNSLKKIRSHGKRDKKDKPAINFDSLIALGKYEIKFFSGLKDKQKERFFSEIGMLLSSGVDLQTILELSLNTITQKNKLKNVYEKINEQIINGITLASAMESTKQFNNFDCYSIKIGEDTGELATVFNKLADYYSKKIVQGRKIKSALSYPIVVLITTIGAVFFMLKFVVPMFSETLVRFGGELPALTKFVVYLSNHISSFFFYFLIIATAGVLFYYYNRNNEKLKRVLAKIVLNIPFVGKVVYKSHLLQFAQAMELLLNARVNIVDSIDLTIKMMQFYPLNNALKHIREDVLKGDFFYNSMLKQTFFDQSMIVLVKIGEEVNQLDKIFAQLAKQYQNDLEYQSGILISILEPVLLLVLALIVGTILIAMYLPMFKIGTVIH